MIRIVFGPLSLRWGRTLLLYKDYMVMISLVLFSVVVFLLQQADWYSQLLWGAGSSLVFLYIMLSSKRKFLPRVISLFRTKLYIVLLLVAGIASFLGVYAGLDGMVIRGTGERIRFLQYELQKKQLTRCESVLSQLHLDSTWKCDEGERNNLSGTVRHTQQT